MSFEFIIRYKVCRISDNPRGGHDVLLRVFENLNKAITWAKETYPRDNRITVIETRYASQNNLNKDFHFDCHIKWASYFND